LYGASGGPVSTSCAKKTHDSSIIAEVAASQPGSPRESDASAIAPIASSSKFSGTPSRRSLSLCSGTRSTAGCPGLTPAIFSRTRLTRSMSSSDTGVRVGREGRTGVRTTAGRLMPYGCQFSGKLSSARTRARGCRTHPERNPEREQACFRERRRRSGAAWPLSRTTAAAGSLPPRSLPRGSARA